jgi:preprotein translocase subunit SecG
MTTLLTILHVTVCLFLMLTVLLQSGKSGGMGAAFGGGNAATVFGGSGASSFLRRLTAGAATIFMLASMTLAFIASHNSGDALEKFGASQADIAAQKEKEKERALGSGAGSNAGSNAGSASIVTPTESSMSAPGSDAVAPTTGDTPIMGSGFSPGTATNPTPNPNGTSAVNPPAQTPTPTTTGSASVPATPKKTDAPKTDAPKTNAPKTDAKRTDAPVAPTTPAQ